jgi:hypothetical protein
MSEMVVDFDLVAAFELPSSAVALPSGELCVSRHLHSMMSVYLSQAIVVVDEDTLLEPRVLTVPDTIKKTLGQLRALVGVTAHCRIRD